MVIAVDRLTNDDVTIANMIAQLERLYDFHNGVEIIVRDTSGNQREFHVDNGNLYDVYLDGGGGN